MKLSIGLRFYRGRLSAGIRIVVVQSAQKPRSTGRAAVTGIGGGFAVDRARVDDRRVY